MKKRMSDLESLCYLFLEEDVGVSENESKYGIFLLVPFNIRKKTSTRIVKNYAILK